MIRKATLIGAVSVLALATGSAAMAELRIGALVPLTGDLQSYGPVSLNGARLAVDEINAAGGVLGEEIEIITGDAQTSPQAGVDAAQRLASVDDVHAFVGALSSGVTIPVASSVSRDEGIPQISNASTSPVITNLEDDDYLFRTVPSDAFQGVALAEITDAAGYETVGVIYINNDYGTGLAEAFASAFQKIGGSITESVAYEGGQSSYRGAVRRAAADGAADALVLIAYPENGQTIVRQALEGGHFSNFVFSDGLKSPELIENIGAEYLNGTIGTAAQARADTPGAEHFAGLYEEAHGEAPSKPYGDTAYDAVYLIALAAQKAGSTERDAIRDALRDVANPPGEAIYPGEFEKAVDLLEAGEDINYEGASGPVDFDDAGDVPGSFAEWAIEDGEIVTRRVFEPEMPQE